MRNAMVGSRIGGAIGGILGGGGSTQGAGGSMGGLGQKALGMLGNAPGILGTVGQALNKPGTKMALKATGVLGAGALAYNKIQDVGETITDYQQLGSMEGGDYATGIKEEIGSRIDALDPFINTDQARTAKRLPMEAGFQGESREQLKDLLINNFKELGISMADSMQIAMSNMRGKELTDKNVLDSRSSSEATVNIMKELSGEGGNTMALSQRIEELKKLSVVLNSLGSGQENIERSAVGWQEGYKDSLALRGSGSKIMGQTMGSSTLMAMVGQRAGVTGYLPNALPAALEEAGLDDDEITNMAAAEAAKYASSQPKYLNRVAVFQSLMADQGVELDWPQAKDLYDRVAPGKERPDKKANKSVARQAGRPSGSAQSPADASWKSAHQGYSPSGNASRVGNSFAEAERIPGDFSPDGRPARPLPQSVNQAAPSVSQGRVSGNVTITVDQAGRVTAPPVIQLTGTQRAVNAGAGAAQLNNTSPGESHATNTFPGGR